MCIEVITSISSSLSLITMGGELIMNVAGDQGLADIDRFIIKKV